MSQVNDTTVLFSLVWFWVEGGLGRGGVYLLHFWTTPSSLCFLWFSLALSLSTLFLGLLLLTFLFSASDQIVQHFLLSAFLLSGFPHSSFGAPEVIPISHPIDLSCSLSVIFSSLANPQHCFIFISSTILGSASYPLCCPFLKEDIEQPEREEQLRMILLFHGIYRSGRKLLRNLSKKHRERAAEQHLSLPTGVLLSSPVVLLPWSERF